MTVWPAAVTVVGLANFEIAIPGTRLSVTGTVFDVAVTGEPTGGVPAAVALSTTEPWSKSVWVTT